MKALWLEEGLASESLVEGSTRQDGRPMNPSVNQEGGGLDVCKGDGHDVPDYEGGFGDRWEMTLLEHFTRQERTLIVASPKR